MPFYKNCSIIVLAIAPVAQRIEQWPPEPCEEVRLFSGALNKEVAFPFKTKEFSTLTTLDFHKKEQKGDNLMHYHIYCNTKNMSHNHLLALDEFKKRLSAYCETTLHTSLSLIFPKEINNHNHQFVYIQNGISSYSSEQFSEYINTLQLSGKSTIHVIIGYNETDFYAALSTIADYDAPMYLSLTNCNLSSTTKTLLFYEQLYRGYTILQGKTYHK